jgi:hypothetical protein
MAFKRAYTNTYWVSFEVGRSGTMVVTADEDPEVEAAKLGKVRAIESLPYPANPVLRRPAGEENPCPEFCYSPQQCKGRTACPKSYACSE